MKYIFSTIILYILLAGCGNSANNKSEYSNNNEMLNSDYTLDEDEQVYKYESRSGVSGDYGYNYDIDGYDENNNYVTGNVDMHGKYGTGAIENAEGEEVSIEVEWFDWGQMTGEDENGITYDLGVQ